MNHIHSPDTTDPGIEREIVAKGLTAPRITPADLEAAIASEHYFTAAEGAVGSAVVAMHALNPDKVLSLGPNQPKPGGPLALLTFCVLVLENGFTVTGESACASPENFDAGIGRKIARENARQKMWPLLGYALKQKLHDAG